MSKITQEKKATKKAKEVPQKIVHISVIDDVYTDVTRKADSEDDWSRDSTSQSHSIKGIKVHPEYGDIDCSFDVEPVTDYYLLYYNYASGDSFGSDTGKIEFIALYNDKELATKSYKALQKAGSNGENFVTIWNDLGQPYQENIDQNYFGGFEGSHLITVQLF